jgi:hypothetical protein
LSSLLSFLASLFFVLFYFWFPSFFRFPLFVSGR